jgi:crossover junction endodeoxyribonuclease RusA
MTFRVHGTPIAQGSMRGFIARGKGDGKAHVILTAANTKTEPWRQDVAMAAIKAKVPHVAIGPIKVQITFHLPRPKSRPKKHTHPDVRPDLDKLQRAVLDALTGIAWRDDAQVCAIAAEKCYTTTAIGADITVEALRDGGPVGGHPRVDRGGAPGRWLRGRHPRGGGTL